MFDFAENGLPTWFKSGSLNTACRRHAVNFIERLANDELLSYKDKIAILEHLNYTYKRLFESVLGRIQLRKSKKLLYEYFLVCAHRLAVKKNFLEAIEVLHKITDPNKEYHTARYAISLYTRTLLAYNLENILTILDKIKVLQLTHAKMSKILGDTPNKKLEFLYGDVLLRQIIPDGFTAIRNLDNNKLDIRFVPGQPKTRSFLRKFSFFTGGATVLLSGAVHYFESAISYQKTFKYYWSEGLFDSINCRYDPTIEPVPPTSSRPSVTPTSLLTSSYLLFLITAFHFAYRFGVTKEKKYLAFSIALAATAIGLCLVSNLVIDWYQFPLAKTQGYNWPWTFDKVGCSARHPYDYDGYMSSLDVKQHDYSASSMMSLRGNDRAIISNRALCHLSFSSLFNNIMNTTTGCRKRSL